MGWPERGYPAPREAYSRSAGPAAGIRYERAQGSGQVTAADTISTLILFSGRPDSIVLTAHENGAIFTLSDKLGRDSVEILLGADASHETFIGYEKVQVRNHAAGSNAHVSATGKWAERSGDLRGR